MKTQESISVLLAEDHLIVREGLKVLLQREADIRIVGEASSGSEAVDMTRTLRPDVVVMDIAMPNLNGLEATRQILREAPGTKVLILSAHSDDAYVERGMEVGAAGYLIKQTSAQFLTDAIRTVHQGKTFYNPSVSSRYTRLPTRDGGPAADRRGRGEQTDRGKSQDQREDCGKAPRPSHAETRHSRYRRTHALRHRDGHY